MKLEQVPNFRVEDYPSDQQSWLGKLFIQLNPFIQAVSQVFDVNVDFGSNIKSVTSSQDMTSFQEFSLAWPYPSIPPVSLQVTYCVKGDDMTPTVLLAAWKYDATNAAMTVTSLTEVLGTGVAALTSGTRYQFKVRATA